MSSMTAGASATQPGSKYDRLIAAAKSALLRLKLVTGSPDAL